MKLTNEAIRQTAIKRLGCADAMVSRYRDSQSYIQAGDVALTDCCGGEFYALSVKARDGEPFEVIARRRTRGELLEAVTLHRLSI